MTSNSQVFHIPWATQKATSAVPDLPVPRLQKSHKTDTIQTSQWSSTRWTSYSGICFETILKNPKEFHPQSDLFFIPWLEGSRELTIQKKVTKNCQGPCYITGSLNKNLSRAGLPNRTPRASASVRPPCSAPARIRSCATRATARGPAKHNGKKRGEKWWWKTSFPLGR